MVFWWFWSVFCGFLRFFGGLLVVLERVLWFSGGFGACFVVF